MASSEIDMEARIARLESDVIHIRSDMAEVKGDLRSLRDKMDSMRDKIDLVRDSINNAKVWALALYVTLAGAMFGTMARGFGWV